MINFKCHNSSQLLNKQLKRKHYRSRPISFMLICNSFKKVLLKLLIQSLLTLRSAMSWVQIHLVKIKKLPNKLSIRLIRKLVLSKSSLKPSKNKCYYVIFWHSLKTNRKIKQFKIYIDNMRKMLRPQLMNKQNKKILRINSQSTKLQLSKPKRWILCFKMQIQKGQ